MKTLNVEKNNRKYDVDVKSFTNNFKDIIYIRISSPAKLRNNAFDKFCRMKFIFHHEK